MENLYKTIKKWIIFSWIYSLGGNKFSYDWNYVNNKCGSIFFHNTRFLKTFNDKSYQNSNFHYVGVDNEITLFQFVKTITPIRGILREILGAIFNVFIEFESI